MPTPSFALNLACALRLFGRSCIQVCNSLGKQKQKPKPHKTSKALFHSLKKPSETLAQASEALQTLVRPFPSPPTSWTTLSRSCLALGFRLFVWAIGLKALRVQGYGLGVSISVLSLLFPGLGVRTDVGAEGFQALFRTAPYNQILTHKYSYPCV